MVDNADVLCVMRTYPHVDGAERALRCAELIHDALRCETLPEMAWCSIPVLWHQSTADAPGRRLTATWSRRRTEATRAVQQRG
jgi:microcystin degradation protein MlrC